MNYTKLILFIVANLFISCSSSQNKIATFTGFDQEMTAQPVEIMTLDSLRPSTLILNGASIIVKLGNYNNNYFFAEYDLESKKLLNQYFRKGSKKGELLGIISSGLIDGYVWAHDVSTNKVSMINVTDTSDIIDYEIPHFFYSVHLNSKTNWVSTGGDSTRHKVRFYNPETNIFPKEFGSYEPVPENVPFNSWRLANEGFVYLNSKLNKTAIALRYSDLLEILDNNSETGKRIQGPEGYLPEYDIKKGYQNSNIIQRNDNTRLAYTKGYSNDKYIYLPYSGNLHHSEHLNFTKQIFVFDWDGNPVLRINLPMYISGFAVDKDNKTVYITDVINQKILKFNINL